MKESNRNVLGEYNIDFGLKGMDGVHGGSQGQVCRQEEQNTDLGVCGIREGRTRWEVKRAKSYS